MCFNKKSKNELKFVELDNISEWSAQQNSANEYFERLSKEITEFLKKYVNVNKFDISCDRYTGLMYIEFHDNLSKELYKIIDEKIGITCIKGISYGNLCIYLGRTGKELFDDE